MAAIDVSPSSSIVGHVLTRQAIDALVERLLGLDLEGRRAIPGMVGQRADILPAGAIVISEAMRVLGADAARVEVNDLLLGHLLRTGAAAALGQPPPLG
jgi:exopolyphosphatase / guanosine-5'-triphosphate,3'-diphosphate pyrophosphatase